jgi:demethoxyubiquinone hydroxylase (CLK1/Coq7/Cat5 family)
VTAAVAAMFVESDEKQLEQDLVQELAQLRDEVRALRNELHAQKPDTTKLSR